MQTTIAKKNVNFKVKRTRRPATPVEILKEEYLVPLELTQKVLTDHLGVDVKVVNRIINNKTGISPLKVIKPAYSFGTSPQFWINVQVALDLWFAEQSLR